MGEGTGGRAAGAPRVVDRVAPRRVAGHGQRVHDAGDGEVARLGEGAGECLSTDGQRGLVLDHGKDELELVEALAKPEMREKLAAMLAILQRQPAPAADLPPEPIEPAPTPPPALKCGSATSEP